MSPVHTTESAPLELALEMGTGKSAQSDSEQEPAGRAALVLVLNHHRDPLDELVDRWRRSGYDVIEASSLAETPRRLRTSTKTIVPSLASAIRSISPCAL